MQVLETNPANPDPTLDPHDFFLKYKGRGVPMGLGGGGGATWRWGSRFVVTDIDIPAPPIRIKSPRIAIAIGWGLAFASFYIWDDIAPLAWATLFRLPY